MMFFHARLGSSLTNDGITAIFAVWAWIISSKSLQCSAIWSSVGVNQQERTMENVLMDIISNANDSENIMECLELSKILRGNNAGKVSTSNLIDLIDGRLFLKHVRNIMEAGQPKNDQDETALHCFDIFSDIWYEILCSEIFHWPVKVNNTTNTCTLQAKRFSYGHWNREHINYRPDVYLYHQALPEQIILEVINISSQMEKSEVVSPTGDAMDQTYRKSHTLWLDPNLRMSKFFDHVTEDISGFVSNVLDRLSNAEQLQIVYYDKNGQYEPHYDFLGQDVNVPDYIRGTGDRAVTLLFYLNDVEEGGATVFPLMRLKVQARKGSAFLWSNIGQNGRPDLFTLHAGCPVKKGSKWVANKWIRSNGRNQRMTCPSFARK